MPTNLPPEYFEVERRYREARSSSEKAELLEEMLSTIPKHKGTDHLRASLRQKLAKLKATADSGKGVSRRESAFRIDREGSGQVVLVGPPNVGKSALLAAVTGAVPEVAQYAFATWVPMPGMMMFENVPIQLIDTPSLNPDHVEPELFNLIRHADLILLMIDVQAFPIEQYENALRMLAEHRIVPATGEQEGTVLGVAHRPTLVVVNKVDDEQADEDFAVLCELLEVDLPLIPISAEARRGLDGLGRAIYDALGVMRIYSKPPGKSPDLTAPFVIKNGATVEEFAGKVHQDFLRDLKSARVWGSAQFDGQMVSRDYVLHEGDVVELRT
jgi:ribosome-interacting GTPase 1